ncbi:MAG: Glyoxalase/bleomycin resistance protein/dioxygenase [Parcubacteria group bacterium Gr01-1014_106]|nr:MAG: Glyoxalase/bleomycin resistance protein/dioxygenase [Parcubacteria group bacterium Gr01-1014_106]
MEAKFIDHILLMIKDVAKTAEFYSKIFGEPLERDGYSVAWKFGDTKVFFALPFKDVPDNTFNRNRVGLNHLAWGVRTLDELRKWEKHLNTVGAKNSGVIKDKYQGREYIWFDDPDGIRQEFYLRPKAGE